MWLAMEKNNLQSKSHLDFGVTTYPESSPLRIMGKNEQTLQKK